jgi:hypothetical protein
VVIVGLLCVAIGLAGFAAGWYARESRADLVRGVRDGIAAWRWPAPPRVTAHPCVGGMHFFGVGDRCTCEALPSAWARPDTTGAAPSTVIPFPRERTAGTVIPFPRILR